MKAMTEGQKYSQPLMVDKGQHAPAAPALLPTLSPCHRKAKHEYSGD